MFDAVPPSSSTVVTTFITSVSVVSTTKVVYPVPLFKHVAPVTSAVAASVPFVKAAHYVLCGFFKSLRAVIVAAIT